ncbi:unnamed protein product [Paramecium sonneborni]|uniref:FHA domain-containing protein n=1 Tax=Paramecium sonneborni TaxID=65129 RepID=A0A8S1RK52_9CILI|nr:unnamed protein product [Paramecium sonneborni]
MPAYKNNLEVLIKQDSKQGIGLIDHEQTETFNQWKFRGGLISIYEENSVYYESNNPQANKKYLLKVTKQINQYEIMLHVIQPTFIVVKDIKSANGSQYPIIANSIIRLGRVEYRVIEERNKEMQITYAETRNQDQLQQNDTNKVYQCRFCFMEGIQSKDQLFLTNICRCVGNSQAVHLDCMRYWVDSNITREETQFGLSLKWNKSHECSICKESLPVRVQYENEYFDLFTLERPELQYILIENVNKEKNVYGEIYLIHALLQDNIKLGRGLQCDIKAQDITVSRHHATIKLSKDNYFVIEDNRSKFGTLVSINQICQIDCVACSLQIGKLLINLIQSDYILKGAPSTQHKLTQLPQISKQLEEDEPQMDDDSFQLENK